MANLPIQPDYSSPVKFTPKVLSANFGDGYTQRAKDGLNPLAENWDLSYQDLTDDEVGVLLVFFADLGGVSHFTWQSKYASAPKKYICSEWDAVPVDDDSNSFSASLVEVFDL